MQITLVSGSTRHDSLSGRVAQYLKQRLDKQSDADHPIIDLAHAEIPFFDEKIFDLGAAWHPAWTAASTTLKQSAGFVFIVPEWGGMVPAAMKNFMTLCLDQELYHKPALLVAVSAGTGGAYPIAEMRQSSYKNTRVCYLPEHVIIRHVNDVIDDKNQITDDYLRQRIDYSLQLLVTYTSAFQQIQAQPVFQHKQYPNGM